MKRQHILSCTKTFGIYAFLFVHQLIAQNNPPDISLTFFLDENSPTGTRVGAIEATDPDGDPLTYSIVSGNTDDAFAIGASSGEITVSMEAAIDFEVNPAFGLMVEANDGQGGMTLAEITINLNDDPLEGVLGLEDLDDLKVFPNPFVDSFTISIEEEDLTSWTVELYSTSGKRVALKLTKSQQEIHVMLDQLTWGPHVLKLSDGNSSYTKLLQIGKE